MKLANGKTQQEVRKVVVHLSFISAPMYVADLPANSPKTIRQDLLRKKHIYYYYAISCHKQ